MIWYHRWRVWCEFIIGLRVPWDFDGFCRAQKSGGLLILVTKPVDFWFQLAMAVVLPGAKVLTHTIYILVLFFCGCRRDRFAAHVGSLQTVGLLPAPLSFCWPLWMLSDCSEPRRFRNFPENWGAIQSLVAPKIIGPLYHPLSIMPNALVSMRNRSPHPILYYNLRRNWIGDSSAKEHPGRLRISGQTGVSPQ